MKFKILCIFLILFISFNINTLNYITTAESVSWNGAYTSVADGFESMLYNPAGLYYSHTKYGLNFFGSYGFRMFNNSISSSDAINLLQYARAGQNLTQSGILPRLLNYMPESGLTAGADASVCHVMTYYKYDKFAIGVSVILKGTANVNLNKGIFETLFNELDFTKSVTADLNAFLMVYYDYNFILSTRAKFLEKYIPVDGIYVGLSTHIYQPVLFALPNLSINIGPGAPDSNGFISNYQIRTQGNFIAGANGMFANMFNTIPGMKNQVGDLFNYAGSAAFGLGLDAGFLVKFNRYVRLGFAVTDLGFIVFPTTAVVSIDKTETFSLSQISSYFTNLTNSMFDALREQKPETGPTQWWMPDTSMRVGVAYTPFKTNIFTWATDVSLSDFNLLLIKGYPTFNFSTGIEFMPSYKWFAVPLRVAFCYNSLANIPSFSFGFGMYFGPVEMEIGVKGLEILISGWGAKEVSAGFDLKYEF